MKSIFGIALCATLLTGCAAAEFLSVGGSRSDGIVTFGCNYEILKQCGEPNETMRQRAADLCKGWGYMEGAQSFGGVKDISGKDEYTGRLEISYQCLGRPENVTSTPEDE